MPFHFEMGLARHDQPVNPWPSHKPAIQEVLTQPKVNINLRSTSIGDGSQAYGLSPAVGRIAPQRWAPAQSTRYHPLGATHIGAASSAASIEGFNGESMLPPSPSTLARAARALNQF